MARKKSGYVFTYPRKKNGKVYTTDHVVYGYENKLRIESRLKANRIPYKLRKIVKNENKPTNKKYKTWQQRKKVQCLYIMNFSQNFQEKVM